MDSITLLGLVAGSLTTAAFFPQFLKTWRTRSTKDISLAMYVVFCLGISLWLVYGFFINSWPVVLANAVTMVLTLAILGLKIKHK